MSPRSAFGAYLVPGGQGLSRFEEPAGRTGFAVVSKRSSQDWSFLELVKR